MDSRLSSVTLLDQVVSLEPPILHGRMKNDSKRDNKLAAYCLRVAKSIRLVSLGWGAYVPHKLVQWHCATRTSLSAPACSSTMCFQLDLSTPTESYMQVIRSYLDIRAIRHVDRILLHCRPISETIGPPLSMQWDGPSAYSSGLYLMTRTHQSGRCHQSCSLLQECRLGLPVQTGSVYTTTNLEAPTTSWSTCANTICSRPYTSQH
jgi:hypothetical protein